jgi:hypothetical protein
VLYSFSNAKQWQRYWDGFTASMNGRFPNGATLAGGFDVGRQVENKCFTVDVPNEPVPPAGSEIAPNIALREGPFCRSLRPWGNLSDFRLYGSYPLPYAFTVSAIYTNKPGVPINADMTVTGADVRFLNPNRRALSSGTARVALHAPNTVFMERFTQLDVRFTRTFNLARARLDTSIDLSNALNSSAIEQIFERYGPQFRRPVGVLSPRLLQLSANLLF